MQFMLPFLFLIQDGDNFIGLYSLLQKRQFTHLCYKHNNHPSGRCFPSTSGLSSVRGRMLTPVKEWTSSSSLYGGLLLTSLCSKQLLSKISLLPRSLTESTAYYPFYVMVLLTLPTHFSNSVSKLNSPFFSPQTYSVRFINSLSQWRPLLLTHLS